MSRAGSTRDLPQASVLPKVRDVVAAIAAGHDADHRAAGVAAGLSPRHADYYGLAATITLGLATKTSKRLVTTALGRELLATPRASPAERAIFSRAIAESTSVTSIAPDLLDDSGPELEALTQRMVHAGLSRATARRRASTLLSWRRYVLDRQLVLDVTPFAPRRARRRRPRG